MKIGIIGWGVEGQSAFRYFGPEHEYLIVNEEPRDDFPPESNQVRVQFLNSKREPGLTGNVKNLTYLDGIEQCDKIVFSVTNAKNLEKKFGIGQSFWSKATTTQHIFFENVATKNIIGVTGTKGKGTTSTLIYEMLKASGKKVFLGGNIGTAVLDFINEIKPEDWVVLELSSFQLYKLNRSPHIAVCLLIAPEHMDWHENMADYTNAKANLFRYQTPQDIAIYFAKNEASKNIAANSPGHKIPYFEPPGAYVKGDKIFVGETEIIGVGEVKLLGAHNLQNVCAAVTAVWQISQNVEPLKNVLKNFAGLPHRLELVREVDGVKFYNDSFASAPDAAASALAALPGKKVMIMGGFDRMLPLNDLARAVQDRADEIRKVLLIGASAKRLATEFDKVSFNNYQLLADTTMPEIIAASRTAAQSGDSVVLSPGFASFGLFKNFEERGNQFKSAVNNL